MNSTIKIAAKFAVLFCGMLMPLMVFGQGGPGPPPPPEGIPFDLVCGVILAGGAMVAGRKIYSKSEAA